MDSTAGADTTGASIVNFILAMTLHPEVQAKAQAEIDRVIDGERLPEFGDEDSLPYVTAVMKELLRYVRTLPILLRRIIPIILFLSFCGFV